MKTTTVKKYTCDFCRKKRYQLHAMEVHELHCTLNPQRVCRMCKMKGSTQRPIIELKQIISAAPSTSEDEYERVIVLDSFDETLKSLRRACGNCPACIMSALRQSKIPVPAVKGFDFNKECYSAFEEINKFQYEVDIY